MVRYEKVLVNVKGDVNDLCSLRATRKLLRYHWYWDIPDSTVEESRDLFNEALVILAEAIVRNHVEVNDRRLKYHLRPKLRLSINKSFREDLLKRVADTNVGTAGEYNRNTAVSNKQEIEVT